MFLPLLFGVVGVISCAGDCVDNSGGANGGSDGKGGGGGGGGGGTADELNDSEIGGEGGDNFFGDFDPIFSNDWCNLCSSCINVSLLSVSFFVTSCMPLISAVKAPMAVTLLTRTCDKNQLGLLNTQLTWNAEMNV